MSEPATLEIISDGISEDEVIFPPGDILSDEPPLESDLHREQIDLLIRILKLWWRERQDFHTSGNLTIYYSPNQKKSEHFRGPDFFVVLGTEKKDRKSWVWQEDGKYPNVIGEILSSSTTVVDKGLKKQVYQDTFRTPDYLWFNPVTMEVQGFHLVDGKYQEIQLTTDGRLWSQQLELYLGVYEGKLRFFTTENQLILSSEELAEQERLRAEQAEERAQQAEERAEQAEQEIARLREALRIQGIDLEKI